MKTLAELPSQVELKTYAGYGEMIKMSRWAELLSTHLGIDVYFEQATIAEWAETLTFVKGLGIELAEMYAYSAEFGSFGPWSEITPIQTS